LQKIIPLIPNRRTECDLLQKELPSFHKTDSARGDHQPSQMPQCSRRCSRKLHQHAQVIYENQDMFDRIKRAWAVWALANMSFNNALNNGFSRSSDGKSSRKIAVSRTQFTKELAERISGVQIECRDALKIIRSRDGIDTLFYIDPPYVGTPQI